MPFFEKCLTAYMRSRGEASLEAAMAMPLMMTVLAFVIVFAMAGWEMLISATGVPLVARSAGAEHGNAAAATAFLPSPARDLSVQRGAPGCLRAVEAQLNDSDAMRVPLINSLLAPLRGGSYTRLWKFWAGPPEDHCR